MDATTRRHFAAAAAGTGTAAAGTFGPKLDLSAGNRTLSVSRHQKGLRRPVEPVVYRQSFALIIKSRYVYRKLMAGACHRHTSCACVLAGSHPRTYPSELVFGLFLVFGFGLIRVSSQARCAVRRADWKTDVVNRFNRQSPTLLSAGEAPGET